MRIALKAKTVEKKKRVAERMAARSLVLPVRASSPPPRTRAGNRFLLLEADAVERR